MPIPLIIAGASAAVQAISGIADGLSSIFGGKKEDKSATGFNNFLNSNQHQAWNFPPALWLTDLFTRMNWPKDVMANMQRTYNQTDGKFQHGDWNCVISSLTPVTIDLFKGSGEHNTLKGNVDYQAPAANYAPANSTSSQASQQIAGYNGTVNPGPAQQGQSQNPFVNASASIMDLINKANQASISLTGSPIMDTKQMEASIAKTIAQNPSNNSQGNPVSSPAGSMPSWAPWAIGAGAAIAIALIATRKK